MSDDGREASHQLFPPWLTPADAIELIEDRVASTSSHAEVLAQLAEYDKLLDLITEDLLAGSLFRVSDAAGYSRFLVALCKLVPPEAGQQLVDSLARVTVAQTMAGKVSSSSLAGGLDALMRCNKALKKHIYANVFQSQFEVLGSMHETFQSIEHADEE